MRESLVCLVLITKKFTFDFAPQTDDYGVFKTSLSNEFNICAATYKLGKTNLVDITVNANRLSFADDLERQLIAGKIERFRREHFSETH